MRETRAEKWGFVGGKTNVILLREDFECEMAEVHVNGRCVYSGNFWDYHPGCRGIDDFEFGSRHGFVSGLRCLALDEGMEVESRKETYSY